MAVNLTKDAIAMVSNGDADLKPLLQVADIRLVNTAQNTAERYRMLLSDGTHMQQAMLATQMNHVVKSGKLQKGSIVRLTEFICNLIQNRKYDFFCYSSSLGSLHFSFAFIMMIQDDILFPF